LWFGSVAEALLRRSQAPLLLIRPEKEDTAQNRWNDREPLRRILVATDGSEASHRAVVLASTFGTMFGAAFELFRVVPAPYEVLGALAAVTVAYTGQDVEESIARARKALEDEAETLRAAGSTVTTEVVIDPSPARAILRHGRDRGSDLVVLATRARGGLDRLLIGSVADKVIRGGEVPLLVLPPDPESVGEANDALIASAEAAARDE
jgi:nucleotide-binding universal stress UspA family protein